MNTFQIDNGGFGDLGGMNQVDHKFEWFLEDKDKNQIPQPQEVCPLHQWNKHQYIGQKL